MEKDKFPFKLNMPYEELEFNLEVMKDRIVGYDSYKYMRKVIIFSIPVKNAELIFYWEVLKVIILEFENSDIEKLIKLKNNGFIRFNNLYIKTDIKFILQNPSLLC